MVEEEMSYSKAELDISIVSWYKEWKEGWSEEEREREELCGTCGFKHI